MAIRDYFAGFSSLPRRTADEEHRLDLLAQFYSTLRSVHYAAQSGTADNSQNAEVDTKIKELFIESLEKPSWRGAYEIEQLLSLMMTMEQLDTEFARRAEEAVALELPFVGTLIKRWEAAGKDNNIILKRAVLLRLLNDLQWLYSQRTRIRAIRNEHDVRVSSLFLSAFTAFFSIILLQFFAVGIAGTMENPLTEFEAGSFFRTYPGLLVAMVSGLLGATFSMLLKSGARSSEGSVEDIKAASSWTTLTVRVSVGLGAAVILYFFFPSGLLGGDLWPDITTLGWESGGSDSFVHLPTKALCLLIIWCFVAGFSETLVPNILTQTEAKVRMESELGASPKKVQDDRW